MCFELARPVCTSVSRPVVRLCMMPGTICGVYASVILSGNPHGGEIAPFLVVASIVNYVFYSTVCYILLAVYVKFSKNILRGNGR
jgi:hypothetical protein